jgi:hypothetical protein
MTAQTRDDLRSSILGIREAAKQTLDRGVSIVSGRMNSDIVENL